MISNERQYQVTKAQAEKFRQALEGLLNQPPAGLPPKALKAMREGTASQLRELEEQIAEYEALRDGPAEAVVVDLDNLGQALVRARVMRRLTQKALAERLDMAEQQIQRYEATQYAGVSVDRLQDVAKALRVRLVASLTPE